MSTSQRILLGLMATLLVTFLTMLGSWATETRFNDSANIQEENSVSSGVVDAAAEIKALGIHIEPYRHGIVQPKQNQIEVVRNGEFGFGVFFRPEQINENRILRFEAKGDERIIVRTTTRGERYYKNAEPNDFVLITQSTDEVLIFTNDASSIDITFNEVVDCGTSWHAQCADARYFADRIGMPESSDLSPKDLLAILDWVSNTAVWTDDNQVVAESTPLVKARAAAQTYATMFRAESSGVADEAAAEFLAKVINGFGWASFSIEFGTGPNLTHVSTLVFDPFGDGKFYMVDPTFNAIFVNEETGDWIPFDDLPAGKVDGVVILERPVEGRRFLVEQRSSQLVDCRPAKGRAGAEICARPGYNFETYMESFSGAFENSGFPPDKAGYMLMLRSKYFNIGNQAGSEVRDRFISLLNTNGIEIDD